jgi:hypothetical protein
MDIRTTMEEVLLTCISGALLALAAWLGLS